MRKTLLAVGVTAALVLPTGLGAANATHKPPPSNDKGKPPPCRDHKCSTPPTTNPGGGGTTIPVPGTTIVINILGNNVITITGLPVNIPPVAPGQNIRVPGVVTVTTGTPQCSIAKVVVEVTDPHITVCIDGDPLSVNIE